MKICLLLFIIIFGFVQNKCDQKNVMNVPEPVNNGKPLVSAANSAPSADFYGVIDPQAKVRKDLINAEGEVVSFEVVTAEERLKELGAKLDSGKLIDGKGREIRFFEPICRGTSEGSEADRQAQALKRRELSELEAKYTVIVLYCDSTQAL